MQLGVFTVGLCSFMTALCNKKPTCCTLNSDRSLGTIIVREKRVARSEGEMAAEAVFHLDRTTEKVKEEY